MGAVGIFFGANKIGITDIKGKAVLSHSQIDRTSITSAELEEKVPDENSSWWPGIKRMSCGKTAIEASEAVLTLSGKDLIIRTFEMRWYRAMSSRRLSPLRPRNTSF